MCEDKGKPNRTSMRYGMKYCHHGTRNRHDMSTHLRKVRTDPNLPICATSVCAVYVPLPWSNCRLYIPIGTRTELHSSVSGLSTQASSRTEHLSWQAINNRRWSNYAPVNAHAVSELDKSSLFSELKVLLILSNLELTFCNNDELKRFGYSYLQIK